MNYKGDLVVDEYDEAVRYQIREAHGSASPSTLKKKILGQWDGRRPASEV